MRDVAVASRDASELREELRPVRVLYVSCVYIAEKLEVPDVGTSKEGDRDLLSAVTQDEPFDNAGHLVPLLVCDELLPFPHGVGKLDVADDAVGVDVCRFFGVEVNSYTEGTGASLRQVEPVENL